jgi:hypothetical protein
MDYFLCKDSAILRLHEEYKKFGKIIIAYDFDDTVYDFHKKGREYSMIISLLKRWKGHAYFIVSTAAQEERMISIKEYLTANQLPYDAINENVPGLDVPVGGKIYYNVLLDDRAGLHEVYDMLMKLIQIIEQEKADLTIDSVDIYDGNMNIDKLQLMKDCMYDIANYNHTFSHGRSWSRTVDTFKSDFPRAYVKIMRGETQITKDDMGIK